MCGQPEISDLDVEQLRAASHCSLDQTGRPHDQVLWFWRIMRGMTLDQRSMVLQFVTGNERPPLTGFQALEYPFTVQVGEHLKATDLPEAHVCFNKLVLPPSESIHILREKVIMAVSRGLRAARGGAGAAGEGTQVHPNIICMWS
jgi:E3 ubiquitin-protein ligase HUWE1